MLIKNSKGEGGGGGGERKNKQTKKRGVGDTLTSSRKDWAELYGCIQ